MIQYEFKERNSTNSNNGVTLIIVTSPIQSHPETKIIDESIQSIVDMNYLFDEMIISYDKPPKSEKSNYKNYKLKMKNKYKLPKYKSLAKKITHLPMTKHGHFIGTFYNALQHCKTKYVFLVQHDIKLNDNAKFPINKCLNYKFDWNIIATHHLGEGLKETHWFPIIQEKIKGELWKVHGWSERIFLTKRDWMMDQIRGCYSGYNSNPNSHYKVNQSLLNIMRKPNPKVKRTHNFMDTIFHKEFDRLYMKTQGIKKYSHIKKTKSNMKVYDQYWDEWKCYLLHKDICYHVHLFGRTAKTKKKNKRTMKRTRKGGCGKGGGKNKSFMKEYMKISNIDCAKKYPKSREKTLICLKDKDKQFKSLNKSSSKEMKDLERSKQQYNKDLKEFMDKSKKECMKHVNDKKKFNDCAKEIGKELEKYDKDIPKIFLDETRDKLQQMIDHTQKVNFSQLKL